MRKKKKNIDPMEYIKDIVCHEANWHGMKFLMCIIKQDLDVQDDKKKWVLT